ncbi:MAG: glycosyltransferase family 2 protein [Acidobacteriia bacterium]|nr:glycosyltransferase family 2 protein [Terriglobia bacterium]
MRRALQEWPIELAQNPPRQGKPDLTFVIPFRGEDRLPLLKMTVQSILAQRGVAVECLVVEQSREPVVAGLPPTVIHLHLPCPDDEDGWHKSWAFNEGVRKAQSQIVVCHDADILAPCDYGKEICRYIRDEGREFVHLQRFLFRLDETNTRRLVSTGRVSDCAPEEVWQNWLGGTIAIRKEAFFRIGGYDEQFVDWGGEDNEFYDRCDVLNKYDFEYLPFIHLWHDPQSTKFSEVRAKNLELMEELLRIPAEERIRKLTQAK